MERMVTRTEQGEPTGRNGSASVNVSDAERMASGIAGAALAAFGIRRGGVPGLAMAALGGALLYRSVTGHSRVYKVMGLRVVRTTSGRQRIEVVRTMTINRPADELYRFWRRFDTLPQVMTHLESVHVLDEKRSHWVARAPGGGTVEWDAEIVNEKENALLAWQSCEGSDVAHWGVIRFTQAPGGRGTEVTIELEYEPVGSTLGSALAKLFGEEPSQQIQEDLRRFKQLMETGEVPTTKGQPRGPRR
ncbi:SRPBCC family protein [Candidatus Nitrospira bockiana]